MQSGKSILFILTAGIFLPGAGHAAITLDSISQDFLPVMAGLGGLAALIVACLAWLIVRRRRSGNTGPLITAIVLLVLLLLPLLSAIQNRSAGDSVLTIDVTGSRWKWHYAYKHPQSAEAPGTPQLAFFSALRVPAQVDVAALGRRHFEGSPTREDNPDNTHATQALDEGLDVDHPLVLPADSRVRFLIHSDDIVHAFWIPDFGIRKDAIPGFANQVEITTPARPGLYRGQGSQLCGQDHAFMPIVIRVLEPQAFERWREQRSLQFSAGTAPETDDAADGAAIFRARCALCHQENGEGWPGRIPALEASTLLQGDDNALKMLLLEGRNGMPGMRDILPPEALQSVQNHLRQRWGSPDTETDAATEKSANTF